MKKEIKDSPPLWGDDPLVVGQTHGALPGQTSLGCGDAFIRRYDADGAELWTKQFGTSEFDAAYAVTLPMIYVAGTTFGTFPYQTNAGFNDAFLNRWDEALICNPNDQFCPT